MPTFPRLKATYWTKRERRSGGRPCKCPRGSISCILLGLGNSHPHLRARGAIAQTLKTMGRGLCDPPASMYVLIPVGKGTNGEKGSRPEAKGHVANPQTATTLRRATVRAPTT